MRLTMAASALGLMLVAAPAAMAQAQATDGELVAMIHIPDGSRPDKLISPEAAKLVFERMPSGDLRHKPSGFICPRAADSLGGLLPGFVTIFDGVTSGHDIGCGMIARGLNATVFVFEPPDGDLKAVFEDERGAARAEKPPAPAAVADAAKPPSAAELGVPASAAFMGDRWVGASGRIETVYIAQYGKWMVHVRISYATSETAEATQLAKRIFGAAASQIRAS